MLPQQCKENVMHPYPNSVTASVEHTTPEYFLRCMSEKILILFCVPSVGIWGTQKLKD